MQYGVTQEENWEGGGRFFFPLSLARKERKEARSRQRSPNQLRRDGWRGEGLERERCSLVGCGSLSGWIDLARVELHHCRALVCFSLSQEKLNHYDALNIFEGDYTQKRIQNNIFSDEVSSVAAAVDVLCCGALRKESHWGKLERRSLCWDTKCFF